MNCFIVGTHGRHHVRGRSRYLSATRSRAAFSFIHGRPGRVVFALRVQSQATTPRCSDGPRQLPRRLRRRPLDRPIGGAPAARSSRLALALGRPLVSGSCARWSVEAAIQGHSRPFTTGRPRQATVGRSWPTMSVLSSVVTKPSTSVARESSSLALATLLETTRPPISGYNPVAAPKFDDRRPAGITARPPLRRGRARLDADGGGDLLVIAR